MTMFLKSTLLVLCVLTWAASGQASEREAPRFALAAVGQADDFSQDLLGRSTPRPRSSTQTLTSAILVLGLAALGMRFRSS